MTTEDNRLASIIYLNEMIGSESKSIEVYRRELLSGNSTTTRKGIR